MWFARNRMMLSLLALAAGISATALAQGAPVKVKEEKPGMIKLAKVTPEAATATAQAKFPTGTIKSGELEKEDGKVIYTFDIQLPGVKGSEEVNIDSQTGAIIKTEHENPVVKPKAKPKTGAKQPPTL